ncbi:hypothetical protein R3P38DRAFT_1191571 [Favolaschia claudopus]|uniref:Transmembrane protein n=1 Tax=Favolaschia claudopus TaxID=2862362 RepID=A0AAW0E2H3_9AGAR
MSVGDQGDGASVSSLDEALYDSSVPFSSQSFPCGSTPSSCGRPYPMYSVLYSLVTSPWVASSRRTTSLSEVPVSPVRSSSPQACSSLSPGPLSSSFSIFITPILFTDDTFPVQGHVSRDCPQAQKRACYTCGSEGCVACFFVACFRYLCFCCSSWLRLFYPRAKGWLVRCARDSVPTSSFISVMANVCDKNVVKRMGHDGWMDRVSMRYRVVATAVAAVVVYTRWAFPALRGTVHEGRGDEDGGSLNGGNDGWRTVFLLRRGEGGVVDPLPPLTRMWAIEASSFVPRTSYLIHAVYDLTCCLASPEAAAALFDLSSPFSPSYSLGS